MCPVAIQMVKGMYTLDICLDSPRIFKTWYIKGEGEGCRVVRMAWQRSMRGGMVRQTQTKTLTTSDDDSTQESPPPGLDYGCRCRSM